MGREERGVPLCLGWWSWAGRQMDPFGMGLPGNGFSQAGLLQFQEAGFALLCLPMAQSGSVQEEEQSPLRLEMLVGVAPFRGSLPGLGVAQVTLRPTVTGPSLTPCLGSIRYLLHVCGRESTGWLPGMGCYYFYY